MIETIVTPETGKAISYDRIGHEYRASYEGYNVGWYASYHEAEVALDYYVTDLLMGVASDTADMDAAELVATDAPLLLAFAPFDAPSCLACGGAHHIQTCPAIRARLFAPAPVVPDLLAEADAVLLQHHLQSFNAAYCLSHGIITPVQLATRGGVVMERRMSYAMLFVPTLLDTDGTRHIIPGRGGNPLCGAERTGAMQASEPMDRRAGDLCQRCVQRLMRDMFKIEKGGGW